MISCYKIDLRMNIDEQRVSQIRPFSKFLIDDVWAASMNILIVGSENDSILVEFLSPSGQLAGRRDERVIP